MNGHYKFLPIHTKYRGADFDPLLSPEEYETHIERIYKSQTDRLNIALDGKEELHALGIIELLTARRLPRDVRDDLLFYGTGYLAHSLYFSSLSPFLQGITMPKGEFLSAVCRDFSSFENFCYEIGRAAMDMKTCGFVWLLVDMRGHLSITCACGCDTPDLYAHTPILALDMWEHAYHMRYRDGKENYLNALLRLIDFPLLTQRYDKAISGEKMFGSICI